MDAITIDPSALPDPTLTEADFRETSFFRPNQASPDPQLPHPQLVRKRLAAHIRQGVVIYEDLKLAVKFGIRTRVDEALTARMINLILPCVPTPEIFGWRVFEGEVYIYMALIHGSLLYESMDCLTDSEKAEIAEQLRQTVCSIWRLRQPADKIWLGKFKPLFQRRSYLLFY
jgi:hypothetical protein